MDGHGGVVGGASISVTKLKAAAVDLQVVEFLVDILSSRVAQSTIAGQDPDVLGVEDTAEKRVGA